MLNGLFVLTHLIFLTALWSMYCKYSYFKYRKQSLENITCSRLLLRIICMCSATQSCLFVNPWTVACQAPLSMGFSRQIYWSGLPFPSPGDHPDPETEPKSPASHADSFALSHQGSPLTGYKNRKSEPKSSKILPFSQHGEVG